MPPPLPSLLRHTAATLILFAALSAPALSAPALSAPALAAEQGDAAAQFNLGLSYNHGEGVLQDYMTAYMWFNLSAALGDEDAAEARDELVKQMTPADISKAQARARQCLEREYKGC